MVTPPVGPIERQGKSIRQLRHLLELTQAQFALKLGVAAPTVVRWENNKTQPSHLALMQLKAMLQELAHSSDTVQQVCAQALLSEYFDPD